MVAKRIIYTISVLSILNSLYLSFVYLETFMLNKFNQELISNFTLILISTLLIITAVITILNLSNKSKKTNLNFIGYFTQRLLPPFFLLFLTLFVYDSLKSDYQELLIYGMSIFIEILSIAVTIGKKRENSLLKLMGIVFIWVCIGTICFSITGVFDEYLGYKELKDPNIRLAFTAIFYHLFNACFLFYSNLPKSMTQEAF